VLPGGLHGEFLTDLPLMWCNPEGRLLACVQKVSQEGAEVTP
jgi:hypothetical protein